MLEKLYSELKTESDNYSEIPFYKKSKVQLTFFYLFCVSLTIAFVAFTDNQQFGTTEAVGSLIYLFFMPFILLNHTWAMYVSAGIYMLDKVAILMMSPQSVVSIMIFSYLCLMLTFKSIAVSKRLALVSKLNSKEQSINSEEQSKEPESIKIAA